MIDTKTRAAIDGKVHWIRMDLEEPLGPETLEEMETEGYEGKFGHPTFLGSYVYYFRRVV